MKRCDPDPEADRDRRRGDLAAELLPPAQAAEVVDRADGRRDRRRRAGARASRRPSGRNASAGTKIPKKSASPPSRGTVPAVQPPPASARSTTPSSRAIPPTAGRQQRRRSTSASDRARRSTSRLLGRASFQTMRSRRLLRPVEPVARVAEAGDDEAPLVQAAVDRRRRRCCTSGWSRCDALDALRARR